MNIHIIQARPTSAAEGLKIALQQGRQQAATKAAVAAPKASAKPAPAKATGPTFTGPNGRAEALAHAVKHDPRCRGKAQSALALLCDDDLLKVGPAGMVKLLQRAPANMALPTSAPRHADRWAHAAEHVNYTRGLADAPPRLAGDPHGWGKIHEKLRNRRGQREETRA